MEKEKKEVRISATDIVRKIDVLNNSLDEIVSLLTQLVDQTKPNAKQASPQHVQQPVQQPQQLAKQPIVQAQPIQQQPQQHNHPVAHPPQQQKVFPEQFPTVVEHGISGLDEPQWMGKDYSE
jgi:hemoglobin-like flavoprotein